MSEGKQIKHGVNEWIGIVRVMRKGYTKVPSRAHTHTLGAITSPAPRTLGDDTGRDAHRYQTTYGVINANAGLP